MDATKLDRESVEPVRNRRSKVRPSEAEAEGDGLRRSNFATKLELGQGREAEGAELGSLLIAAQHPRHRIRADCLKVRHVLARLLESPPESEESQRANGRLLALILQGRLRRRLDHLRQELLKAALGR